MAVVWTMDSLKAKATLGRESLRQNQTITDSMVSILGSFDHRVSALETAIRPTQIRTREIRKAHENIDKTLKAAEVVLTQLDLMHKVEAKILRGPHDDLGSYLKAMDQLRSSVLFFSNNKNFKSSDGVLQHANNFLAEAISKLEDEFRQLLTNYSKPVEPDLLFLCLPNALWAASVSSWSLGDSMNSGIEQQIKSLENDVYIPPTLIPPRVVPSLHDLAQQMVLAGLQQQLFRIYRDIRSSVLEQSLTKLGVERISKDDVQKMQWEDLEAKIENWIHNIEIAVKLLFAGEKKICDQIFGGVDSLRDQCYAKVTANSVGILLSFGEAIAKSKWSPEKLFVLLDMYEIMRDVQSEVENLFGSKACFEMRESALSLTTQLAVTAQQTFGNFEEAVERDATKTVILDGNIHPLTNYVMNYVKFLYDYKSTLKQLLQDYYRGDPDTQLASVTTRVVRTLLSNLDWKSKEYRDPALTQIFLMNNIHSIVSSVRTSEAKDLLGDDWVQIHRRIVQQHANQYKRVCWAKILLSLSVHGHRRSGSGSHGGDGSGSGMSKATVKDRLKTFNTQFEVLHQRQSQWTVPDTELRESLRLAVAEVLLPAYRLFIRRFGPMFETGKNSKKYIKYTPEDLEGMLNEFFENKTSNVQKH